MRAERISAAADDAFVAGDVTRTRALVDVVLHGSAPAQARGQALFTLGMLEQYAGSVPRSIDHLSAACDLLDGLLLVRALAELALANFRLNNLGAITGCADRLSNVADRSEPEQRLLADFTAGMSLIFRGDPEAGGTKLAEVRSLALSDELRDEPRVLLPIGPLPRLRGRDRRRHGGGLLASG